MKIYFAGSIRGGRDDAAIYTAIVRELQRYGRVFSEHVGDPQLEASGEGCNDSEIHDRDLAWLEESDCLVAEVTTPSLGVGYEIAKSIGWHKPILCLFRPNEGRVLSAMIAGSPAVSVRKYESSLELEAILAAFFAGLRQVEE